MRFHQTTMVICGDRGSDELDSLPNPPELHWALLYKQNASVLPTMHLHGNNFYPSNPYYMYTLSLGQKIFF